jgi:preprotein translocase subunit SecG
MLVIVVIVIITVVLLISMDRVSGRQTFDGRSRKAADDRFLNRFLHRRRPKP